MQKDSPWMTPSPKVAELRRRWKAGETAGMIAAALGLSRGAVMGKLNRLGLLGYISAADRRRRVSRGTVAALRRQA